MLEDGGVRCVMLVSAGALAVQESQAENIAHSVINNIKYFLVFLTCAKAILTDISKFLQKIDFDDSAGVRAHSSSSGLGLGNLLRRSTTYR